MYLVITNAPADHSKAIARTLVDENIAACVNRIPEVLSFYKWKGRSVEDTEDILLIKVRKDRYDDLLVRLKTLHPYSVPELLALEPAKVLDAYRDWVYEAT